MNNTIATLLTGRGRGAVATIIVDGPEATSCVMQHFQSALRSLRKYRLNKIYFGSWNWANYREELVICRVGDQRIEIHCHGGRLAAQNILDSLCDSGAQVVDANDWLARKQRNRFVREALSMLPKARTERAAGILLDQSRSAMTKSFVAIRGDLNAGKHDAAISVIEEMLSFASLGLRLVRPFSVVLIGPPNSGKSSLVNAIVGFDRAIVYDQPGTTRDLVSAETALDGWPVTLTDTAGIRNTDDRIERAGMKLAQELLGKADLVLLIQDLSGESDPPDSIEFSTTTPSFYVGTKSDLAESDGAHRVDITTSASTGNGIDTLSQWIVQSLVPQLPPTDTAIPTSEWQVEQLQQLLLLVRQQLLDDASELLTKLLA